MVERKAFLAKSKPQYHVSQQDERDWGANNKRNGDYLEYPSFSHFTMNVNYMESGGQKSFSCETKASILYPNERNLIGVPITKRMEVIKSIQVYPLSP